MSTSSASSATSGTLGNVAPVSFPGIASGIDYNSIIEKYTADTLAQEKPTQAQINNLTSQNAAVLKIKDLLGSVQDSLTALSDPATFGAFKATVANTASGSAAATASQIAGSSPIAGTYTINAQTVATSTVITNNVAANGALNPAVALDTAGSSITATNGTSGTGKITINGVQINYDVTSESLNTIIANINASAAGVTATYNAATGTVSITGVTTLGSGADSGNLEQVLKLDTAQINAGTVVSSSAISGLNATSVFNQNGNAGFATGVSSGTFTINGVQFTLDATKNSLSDVLKTINASNAGVTATYNSSTSSLTLTSKTAGPQSILLGASSDTSNFLTAAGLKTGTTKAGTQASLTFTDSSGTLNTVYSATNDFTSAIPGIDLDISSSSPTGFSGTYYTVNVAADPTSAETAINAFVKSYNAVIVELNKDTVAPTVTPSPTGTGDVATSSSSGGGVLYGNFQVSSLRDQLVNLVSGFVPSGSNSYNSLASIGLTLDTSSSSVGTASDTDDSTASGSADSTNGANNSFIVNATSGQLAALDTTTFEAAFAANTSAVQSLFTLAPVLTSQLAGAQPVVGSNYGFSYLFGTAVSQADGLSTFLKNQVVTPSNLNNALLTSITDSNNQQIDSLQQQIALINQEATAQADSLRQQFTASESQIAELQALQGQISAIGH